jgi:hypothetical protein
MTYRVLVMIDSVNDNMIVMRTTAMTMKRLREAVGFTLRYTSKNGIPGHASVRQ